MVNMTPEEVKQNQLKVLEETVNFYNSTNRGFSQHLKGCVYFDKETNRKCAVGRLVNDDEVIDKLVKNGGDAYDVFDLLPKDVQVLGSMFLFRLQTLHDDAMNWTPTGLSEIGKIKYGRLKNNIINGSWYEDNVLGDEELKANEHISTV